MQRTLNTSTSVLASLLVTTCLLASTGSQARAQTLSLRRFTPVPGPNGILGVDSSRGMGRLRIHARLTTDYANDELVLRTGGILDSRPIAHRLVSELGLSVGLWNRLDLGLSLPVVAGRWARGRLLPGQRRYAFGLASPRLVLKGVFLRNDRGPGFGLAALLDLSVPSGMKDQFLSDTSPVLTSTIVADYRFSRGGVVTLNLGYLLRKKTWILDLPVDDELRFAAAAEVPLRVLRLSLLGAVEGALGLGKAKDGKRIHTGTSPAEARMGLRWYGPRGIQATLGTGVGLTQGYGAPDVRVLLSVGFSENLATGSAARGAPGGTTHPSGGATAQFFLGSPARPMDRQQRTGKNSPTRRPSAKPGESGPNTSPKRQAAPDRTALPASKRPSDASLERIAAQDPDPDGDGLAGKADRCPKQPEDKDGFRDSDGCPDPDNDQDGIPDLEDKCPLKPETVNGVADDDGCPDKGRAQVRIQRHQIRILQKVLFAPGSDRIDPSSYPLLRQVAAVLKKAWWIRLVRIEGHTDNRGDPERNVDLSIRRAYRVRAFLMSQGIEPERLDAKGYGSSRPVADNGSKRGRARNRRVVFRILQTTRHPSTGPSRVRLPGPDGNRDGRRTNASQSAPPRPARPGNGRQP